MRAAAPTTIDVPPLSLRADVSSINDTDRSVELVFSTGAAVPRYDWLSDKRYLEQLEISKNAIRTDRLQTAPLLDAHSAWSISDQIGCVVPDSFRIANGQAIVRVRFSKREQVEPIWQDVKDRIIQNVSVGYRVHKFEEDASKANALPVRTAVDWEPYEISMVPMPADTGARVRRDEVEMNTCVVIPRSVKERTMPDERDPQQSETIVERDPVDPGAPRLRLAEPTEPTDRDAGVAAERARMQGILLATRAARLPQAFADKLIAEGTELVRAQTLVFEELSKRDLASAGPRPGASAVIMGDDPLVHVRAGIENALLHRVAPELFKLDDTGRPYRGMTLLDIARTYLQARGIRTTGFSKMELAGAALGVHTRGGMHTTSDFPLLLADVANKTLRRAYDEAPQTFTAIGRRVTLPDFKPVYRNQLGDAPELLEVLEHGEFKRGTIGEGREQFQLATYGRVFAITRKALVNDDTDAFGRISTQFGRAARNLESNLAWFQITSNPTMGDSELLFSAAHLNVDASGDVISVESLGAARAAMRSQLSLDGEKLNIAPKFLIVPVELETKAEQITAPLVAQTQANVNPFSGRLTVITEPRLTDALAWYLGASPDTIDMLEYGTLEGEDGPMVESRIGFDVDGLEIKCRHDFAAKVIDWRGFYKNAGDQNT